MIARDQHKVDRPSTVVIELFGDTAIDEITLINDVINLPEVIPL